MSTSKDDSGVVQASSTKGGGAPVPTSIRCQEGEKNREEEKLGGQILEGVRSQQHVRTVKSTKCTEEARREKEGVSNGGDDKNSPTPNTTGTLPTSRPLDQSQPTANFFSYQLALSGGTTQGVRVLLHTTDQVWKDFVDGSVGDILVHIVAK